MRVPVGARSTTIYRHFDKCGCLLYVGVAYDTAARTHVHNSTSWWSQWSTRVEVHKQTYDDRAEALAAEREFIRAEVPAFNTVHAQDRDLSVVRYLLKHKRWEHLSVRTAVPPREKPEVIRSLDRAGLLDRVVWHQEPDKHVVDWSDQMVRSFVAKTADGAGGCWRWQGHIAANGRGTFRHPETRSAPRASYLIFRGPLADNVQALPDCGTKDCVAPLHLKVRPRKSEWRSLLETPTACRQMHPNVQPRWSKRTSGRTDCLECHRLREQQRRKGAA